MSSANQVFFFQWRKRAFSPNTKHTKLFLSLFFFKQCCIKLPDIIAKHYISGNGLIACTAF